MPGNLGCMAATGLTMMPLSAVCCPGHPDRHSSTSRGPAASCKGNEPCNHKEAGSGRASTRSQVSCTATARETQDVGLFGTCNSTGCSKLWPESRCRGSRSPCKGSRGCCSASPHAELRQDTCSQHTYGLTAAKAGRATTRPAGKCSLARSAGVLVHRTGGLMKGLHCKCSPRASCKYCCLLWFSMSLQMHMQTGCPQQPWAHDLPGICELAGSSTPHCRLQQPGPEAGEGLRPSGSPCCQSPSGSSKARRLSVRPGHWAKQQPGCWL